MNSSTSDVQRDIALRHRLTLPKFLLKEANRMLLQPGTYSHGLATSILQDAAETFLRILASELGVNVHQNHSFSQVLGAVATRVPKVAQYRADLTKLNSARVMFKHQGLSTLQKNDVIVFAGNVSNFVTDLCATELDIDFATVSLADAIGHRRTQNWITMAEESFAIGDLDAALQRASGAMAIYLAHNNTYESALNRPRFPLTVNLSMSGLIDHFSYENTPVDAELRSKINDFAEWVIDRIDSIDERVRLLARGVNVSSYEKFVTISPHATIMQNGEIQFVGSRVQGPPSADDVRFCIDTVIDTALALRTNRPPILSRFGAPRIELRVTRSTQVFINPNSNSPEIIRQLNPGDLVEALSSTGRKHDEDYVAILQDGDVAYVHKTCVEETPTNSNNEVSDT